MIWVKFLPLIVVFSTASFFFFYQYCWFRATHSTVFATNYLFYGWKSIYSSFFTHRPFAVFFKYSCGRWARLFYEFLSLAWYFNFVINYFVLRIFLLCRFFYESLDRGLAEFFFGATRVFKISARFNLFCGFVSGGYPLLYLLLPVIFLIFFSLL
jgi:hypothetical protein